VSISLDNDALYGMDNSVLQIEPGESPDGTFDLPGAGPLFSPGQHEVVTQLDADISQKASIFLTIGDASGQTPPLLQFVNLFNQPNGSVTTPAQLWPAT
jgi:hypothetical protein